MDSDANPATSLITPCFPNPIFDLSFLSGDQDVDSPAKLTESAQYAIGSRSSAAVPHGRVIAGAAWKSGFDFIADL
jgi:hypothetical protein